MVNHTAYVLSYSESHDIVCPEYRGFSTRKLQGLLHSDRLTATPAFRTPGRPADDYGTTAPNARGRRKGVSAKSGINKK